ncbi:hypothetical protein ANANG_G00312530 [Anguilla anguilla]|uniref:Uncharacterized protein n=1 Tax=Anguilla anguilla TaxID=7936 RepID=A0A9D3LHA6_ANGAN|nr:hypothetical protein ANANG_G00312530 [Anguilla anguilla]
MVVLNAAAAGPKASSSFPALLLAALLGLGPVHPSLIPLTSSDTDRVHLETASDSQVRRTTSNRNGLSSAFDRDGSPFLHRPTLSRRGGLQLSLEGAEVPDVSGQGPPAPSLFPPKRDGTPSERQQRKRRRRNQEVDSSDPLCLHGQRGRCSHSQKEEQKEEQTQEQTQEPETEQSHAISKETITSTSDDPFNVVQPPEGPGSPRSVGTDKALTKKRTAAGEEEQA